jgi:phage terminase large subunit-like protein
VTALDDAFGVLASLVIDDGRRWGQAATQVQRDDARAILDPLSQTPYHFVTRSRGYAKTDDAAGMAIGVMLAQLDPGSRVYALAADRDQGRLIVDSVEGFVGRTPELAGALSVDAFKVTARRSGSTLEVLAADAPSSYGLRPAFLVVDELAQWGTTEAPRRLFDATTSALAKVRDARCVVITSAGDPAHWSYKIREHALVDPLWRVHEVPGPPPWIDPARLEEQRRRLLPSMYARLFENRWTASEDRLTTVDDLRACVTLDGPKGHVGGRRYAIGVDLGLRNDRTVVVVCSIDEAEVSWSPGVPESDDPFFAWRLLNSHHPLAQRPPLPQSDDEGGLRVVQLDRIGVWAGSRERPVDLGTVEAWITTAHDEYNSPSVVCDPYQAELLMQRLARRGARVIPYVFTQQSVSRLAQRLFRLIGDHAIAVPPDAELLDELANVRLRETSPGVHRIDHDPDKHDDRVIALGLACWALLDDDTGARRQVVISPRLPITGDLNTIGF